MSIKALNWAWSQDLKTGPKFALVALADYADADGCCWPAYGVLADKCGMSERSVKGHIQALEAAGYLVKTHRRNADKQGSNVYKLVMAQGADSAPSEPVDKSSSRVQDLHAGVGVQGAENVIPGCRKRHFQGAESAPKPSIEPPMNQKHSEKLSTEGDKNAMRHRLKTKLAALGFSHSQVHTPKVMAMLNRWAEQGVTEEGLELVVVTLREAGRKFSPAYLDGPVADWMAEKKNPGAGRGNAAPRDYDREHAEAEARTRAEEDALAAWGEKHGDVFDPAREAYGIWFARAREGYRASGRLQ